MSANKTFSSPDAGLDDLGSSWAPAGWTPSESFYDDAPFGSVLGDPLMGSPIFDVSVLDAVPGWQDEDAGTAPEPRPAEAAPSAEERAHVASSERIKEGARRRTDAHRQAARTTSRTTAPTSTKPSAARTSKPRTSAQRTAAPSTVSTVSGRAAAPAPMPAPVALPGAGPRQVPSYPQPLPPGAPGGTLPGAPSAWGPGAANPSWGSAGPRGAGRPGPASFDPYTWGPQQAQPRPPQAGVPFPQGRPPSPQSGLEKELEDSVRRAVNDLRPYSPWIILVAIIILFNLFFS